MFLCYSLFRNYNNVCKQYELRFALITKDLCENLIVCSEFQRKQEAWCVETGDWPWARPGLSPIVTIAFTARFSVATASAL